MKKELEYAVRTVFAIVEYTNTLCKGTKDKNSCIRTPGNSHERKFCSDFASNIFNYYLLLIHQAHLNKDQYFEFVKELDSLNFYELQGEYLKISKEQNFLPVCPL